MKTTLDYLLNLVLNFNIRETYYATVLQNIYTGTVKVYTINIKTKQHLLVKNHFKTIQLFWRYALKFSHKDALKSDNELAFMYIKISVFFNSWIDWFFSLYNMTKVFFHDIYMQIKLIKHRLAWFQYVDIQNKHTHRKYTQGGWGGGLRPYTVSWLFHFKKRGWKL